MANTRRLTHSFFLCYLAGTTLSVLIIGLFWLVSSYQHLQEDKNIFKKQSVEQQLEQLKTRVHSVVEMIQAEQTLNISLSERELQERLLRTIEKMTFEGKGYVFVTRYDGVSLSYPAKGKNMYEVTDSQGVKIVQEMIKLAQSGGGYLHYVMPPLQGQRSEQKVSYVEGIEEWQWYIGTGDFVADLDQELATRLGERVSAIKWKVATILLILVLFLLLGYAFSRNLRRRVQSGFDEFLKFFDQAAREATPMASKNQPFSEFKQLADAANLMLEQRNHYEKDALESRQLIRSIIDSMPSILLTIDDQGRINQWNTFATQETGLKETEAIGQPAQSCLPYLKDRLDDILTTCCRQQLVYQATFDLELNDGIRTKQLSAYPLNSAVPQRVVLRIDDITDRIRVEEMMVQTEKMMSIGGLAAGMAHEINNPLSIISQATQNTLRRISPELPANLSAAEEAGIDLVKMNCYFKKRGILGFFDNMLTGVDRSAEIIKNMLSFSSSSASHRELCSLQNIIDSSIKLVHNDYDRKTKKSFKNIQIAIDLPDDLPKIAVNRIEIQQVIFNLLRNAGQAMFEIETNDYQPQIQLSAEAREQMISLTVKDNGPGIPEQIQSRIFEPFFTTKEVGVGTGLGLSVSYYIVVKRHNGHFRIDSQPGQGSTFTIELPLET